MLSFLFSFLSKLFGLLQYVAKPGQIRQTGRHSNSQTERHRESVLLNTQIHASQYLYKKQNIVDFKTKQQKKNIFFSILFATNINPREIEEIDFGVADKLEKEKSSANKCLVFVKINKNKNKNIRKKENKT